MTIAGFVSVALVVVAVALIVYLIIAIVDPERF